MPQNGNMSDTPETPDRTGPRYSPTLHAPDVTPLERETVKRLRSESGWYQGDRAALQALRDYAKKLSANPNPT